MDNRVTPVIISIILIIVLAILSDYSKTLAAITTTMPTKIPLAIWVIWAAEHGNRKAMTEFNMGLLIGIVPTVLFVAAAWWAARAGWPLVPILGAGYVAWGGALGLLVIAQKLI